MCTDYNDKRVPSKSDMEEIAWIIRTKDVNRQVGFTKRKWLQRRRKRGRPGNRALRIVRHMNMLEFLKHVLNGQNQFASGGLLLMIIGALGAYLRAIPSRIWLWVVDQTTLSITVKDEDAAFAWVKQWFAEQKFLNRIRRVDLDTTVRNENLALIPAPGRHWFWYRGRPFRVDFYRSEDTRGWTPKRSELLVFQTLGRDQSLLKAFVTEIASCHKKHERVCSSLYVYSEYWGSVEGYTARLLDSVILQAGERERLVADIEKFKSSKARYRQLGVPYHRGYLLYGPPGTGKTSLVSAVAGKFAMSIYAINLTDFNDRSLTKAMNDVPPGSVVLFEDVDCMIASKVRRHAEKPSAGSAPGKAGRQGRRRQVRRDAVRTVECPRRISRSGRRTVHDDDQQDRSS